MQPINLHECLSTQNLHVIQVEISKILAVAVTTNVTTIIVPLEAKRSQIPEQKRTKEVVRWLGR